MLLFLEVHKFRAKALRVSSCSALSTFATGNFSRRTLNYLLNVSSMLDTLHAVLIVMEAALNYVD